jgi:signal recognition particle GTPase
VAVAVIMMIAVGIGKLDTSDATRTGWFVTVPSGVLIIGVYGSGKTSVCEEIAEVLGIGRYGVRRDRPWLAGVVRRSRPQPRT